MNTYTQITDIATSNPNILGGTPVFAGTRVPITHLLQYIEDGGSLDGFTDSFPTVTREQALNFIKLLKGTSKNALRGI